jgi:acetolactate synthase I/III small subunit
MLSLLVANEPGVLGRICAVFSKRGINIASLVVSDEKVNGLSSLKFDSRTRAKSAAAVSRICIGVDPVKEGQPAIDCDQLVESLLKQVDVLDCKIISADVEPIAVELMLVKIRLTGTQQGDLLKVFQVVEHFEGKTIEYDTDCLVCMITGRHAKLNAAFSVLNKEFEVVESMRTGQIVMTRGTDQTSGQDFCQTNWNK